MGEVTSVGHKDRLVDRDSPLKCSPYICETHAMSRLVAAEILIHATSVTTVSEVPLLYCAPKRGSSTIPSWTIPDVLSGELNLANVPPRP